MHVFWSRGYDSTSVQHLVQGMGINRFSLYDVFGDKQQLFASALDHYVEHVFAPSLRELEQPGAGLRAIERYFKGLQRWARSEGGKHGCLLVNTVVEGSRDPAVKHAVKTQSRRVVAAFRHALSGAQHAGELRTGIDVDDQAQLLALVAHGGLANMKLLGRDSWLEGGVRALLNDLRAR